MKDNKNFKKGDRVLVDTIWQIEPYKGVVTEEECNFGEIGIRLDDKKYGRRYNIKRVSRDLSEIESEPLIK